MKQNEPQDVSWVVNRKTKGYTFFAQPVVINAPIDAVWALEKDVEHYEEFSDHAVRAHVDGPVAIDKPIRLDMYTNECIGKIMSPSHERISVVDEERKVLGWERKLPLSKPSERYAVLERSSDNPNQTVAYIGLKVPDITGFFSHLLFKRRIEKAFDRLNEGFKREAESMDKMVPPYVARINGA
jgi:hypothetical protein